MEAESKVNEAAVREMNMLEYRLAPAVSVMVARAAKKWPAQVPNISMGNDTLRIVCASGSAFVDARNSTLAFTVTFSSTQELINMSPKVGWAQSIKAIRITHSSGVELDRANDSHGEWLQIVQNYGHSEARRRTQGQLYDLNDTCIPSTLMPGKSRLGFAKATEGIASALNEWDDRANAQLGGYSQFAYDEGPPPAVSAVDATALYVYPPYGGPDMPLDANGRTTNDAAVNAYVLQTGSNLTSSAYYQAVRWRYLFHQNQTPAGRSVRVEIPLSHLHPFYANPQLMPPFLIAGHVLEIDFHTPSHFFQRGRGKPEPVAGASFVGDVRITEASLNLECFQPTDSIARKISEISSSNGLEWDWTAVHHAFAVTDQTAYTMQITRALSRANNVIVKTRYDGQLNNPDVDSYESLPIGLTTNQRAYQPLKERNGTMTEFQVQLGAHYMPAAPIQTPKEFYHSALKTFSQFRRSDELSGPTFAEFCGLLALVKYAGGPSDGPLADPVPDSTAPVSYQGFSYKHGEKDGLYGAGQSGFACQAIAAIPIESSSTLGQAGAPISAQRTAVVSMKFQDATPLTSATYKGKRIDMFVEYTKLATVFLDSVVVRS